MKTALRLSLIIIAGLFLVQSAWAKTAVARIEPTTPESEASGVVRFEETDEGLQVHATLEHVPEGLHGFHIHEKGDCGDSGKAAGGHFNPDGVTHGLLSKDGFTHAHAGDLGNIAIDRDGAGHLETMLAGLSLETEPYNVLGRAVILHAQEDDFGQPTGNAGGRIGCGVIESVQ